MGQLSPKRTMLSFPWSVVDSSNLFERLRRVVTGEAVPLFGKTMPERIDSDKYAVSQVKVATARGLVSLSVASPLDPIHRTVDRVQTAYRYLMTQYAPGDDGNADDDAPGSSGMMAPSGGGAAMAFSLQGREPLTQSQRAVMARQLELAKRLSVR